MIKRFDKFIPFVCKACGAQLEVLVYFKGKIVWSIEPGNPEFGSEQPSLRGETEKIKVICTADIFHDCGYHVINGNLRDSLER